MKLCSLLVLLVTLLPTALPAQSKSAAPAIHLTVDGVQRDQLPFQARATANVSHPQWHWEVLSSDTQTPAASAEEAHPTFSLPQGTYDILLTDKSRHLSRHFRRIITVLPRVFTEAEADEVIDLSKADSAVVIRDYQKALRPGYKILIKGKLDGRIKFTGLHGTREHPVHIINQGQVEINARQDKAPYAWQWSSDNQYILLDGKADPRIPYGFRITGHPTKSGQVLFIGGEFNKGFELCGVYIQGHQGKTAGAAGIQLQTSYTPACNATNWSFEYFKAHHLKVENASSEGFYIGYFTEDLRTTGYGAYRLGTVLLYRDTVLRSGWDALQIASADEFEVHDNYFDGASLSGKRAQSSIMSWNGGNKDGWFYRNTCLNSAHALSVFFGNSGQHAYIYANLFVEGRYPANITTNNFFYAKVDNTHQPVGLYIFNNTIKTTRMAAKVAYTNTTSAPGIPVVFANNAIVLNQVNLKKYPEIAMGSNLKDSAAWVIRNQWCLQKEEAHLLDATYRPAAPSTPRPSPAPLDVQQYFPALKGGYYDREGYPLTHAGQPYPFGCYSRVPLTTKP